MMTAAVLGAFIIGTRELTLSRFIRQFLVVIGIGVGLTYLGVLRTAQQQAGYFGDLRVVERSRLDQSRAQSGFGQEVMLQPYVCCLPFGQGQVPILRNEEIQEDKAQFIRPSDILRLISHGH